MNQMSQWMCGEYIYFLYSGEVTIPVTSNKIGNDDCVIGSRTDMIAPDVIPLVAK